jgi:hypothetical protein
MPVNSSLCLTRIRRMDKAHASRSRAILTLARMALVPLVVAFAACSTPAVTPAASVATSDLPQSPSSPCAFPAPLSQPADVLPAPAYFLGSDSQIWRLAADGATLTQITRETAPVRYFDVSSGNGALAYIVANTLICADYLGGGRTVLVQGPELSGSADESRLSTEINRLRWSPTGTQIAYGLNGVNLYDLPSASSAALVTNSAVPTDFATPITGPLNLYSPGDWSPDGSRLLLNVSFYPEGGGLAILNPVDKSLVNLSSPDGLVCCYTVWSSDSKAVFFANDSIGMVASGLWRADAATGAAVTLIPGETGGTFNLVAHPYSTLDGRLAYFWGTTSALPQTFVPLTMTRSDADGVSNRSALRADTALPYEALWSTDGNGVLIVDRVGQLVTEQEPYLVYGPLVWLNADATAPVMLPARGFALHWGK